MQFQLNDMVCGGCARSVTKAIQTVDPAATIQIRVEEHLVEVDSQLPASRIAEALTQAGFPPSPQQ